MRVLPALFLLYAIGGGMSRAQTEQPPTVPTTPELESETVTPTATPPPAGEAVQAAPASEGFMAPQEVQEVLHRLWLTQYRISDLLTEVHPERWKLPETARVSFQDSLDGLRKQMEALEGWRAQFEERPDSMYLAFMTHASIGAILPRLDGVSNSITQRENPSFGAQFSEAGNQLFDLQQELQPYLIYLLRNQDQFLRAAQANLANCQNELGFAMRGRSEPAKLMKNVVPQFKGRRVRERAEAEAKAEGSGSQEPATKK